MPNKNKIIERIKRTKIKRRHKYLSYETLMAKKTKQNFLNIESNQVHFKARRLR